MESPAWVAFAEDGTGSARDFWSEHPGPGYPVLGDGSITTATGKISFRGYDAIDVVLAPGDAATMVATLSAMPAIPSSTPAGSDPPSPGPATRLGIVHPDGSTDVIDPGPGTVFEDRPVWSPDGSRFLAIGRRPDASPVSDAFIVALASPSPVRVDDVGQAIWSADGTSLVLVRSREPRAIEIVGADGHGRRPVGDPAPDRIVGVVWQR